MLFISQEFLDLTLLKKQKEKIDSTFKVPDGIISTSVKSPKELKQEFEDQIRLEAKSAFNSLYRKSLESNLPKPLIFNNLKSNPSIVYKPDQNLKNFVHKDWVLEAGEANNFAVSGLAKFDAGSDYLNAEGVADIRVDVKVLNLRPLNLMYVGGQVKTKDALMMQAAFSLEVLGEKIDRLSLKQEKSEIKWIASEHNSGGIWSMMVKKGQTFQTQVGPVPVVTEAGAIGRVYLDWGMNAGAQNVSFNATPGLDISAYFSGALGVEVARTGVESQLVLIKDEFNLTGETRLLIANVGRPEIVTKVVGINSIKALQGKAVAFAEVEVPMLGSKRHEKELFNWSGISKSGTWFDFQRNVNEEGFALKGSPSKNDISESELDKNISNTFSQIEKDITSQKVKSLVQQVESTRSRIEGIRSTLNQMLR